MTAGGRIVPGRETPPSFSQASTWQQSPMSYEKRPADGFEGALSPPSSNATTAYSGVSMTPSRGEGIPANSIQNYGPNNSFSPSSPMAPAPPVPNEKTMAYAPSHKVRHRSRLLTLAHCCRVQ